MNLNLHFYTNPKGEVNLRLVVDGKQLFPPEGGEEQTAGFEAHDIAFLVKAATVSFSQVARDQGWAEVVSYAQYALLNRHPNTGYEWTSGRETKRRIFLAQSPNAAAEYSCTTINKRVMLEALDILGAASPPGLTGWLLDCINREGIVEKPCTDPVTGETKDTFVYLNGPTYPEGDNFGERILVGPYVADYAYWEIARQEGMTDNDLLVAFEELRASSDKDDFQVIGIRDGAGSEGTHSLAAVLERESQRYRILDSYHGDNYGQYMDERFGTGNPRWLHLIYGYTRK